MITRGAITVLIEKRTLQRIEKIFEMLTVPLYLLDAQEKDIDEIIALESHPENKDYLWVGTADEHRAEIADPNHS